MQRLEAGARMENDEVWRGVGEELAGTGEVVNATEQEWEGVERRRLDGEAGILAERAERDKAGEAEMRRQRRIV